MFAFILLAALTFMALLVIVKNLAVWKFELKNIGIGLLAFLLLSGIAAIAAFMVLAQFLQGFYSAGAGILFNLFCLVLALAAVIGAVWLWRRNPPTTLERRWVYYAIEGIAAILLGVWILSNVVGVYNATAMAFAPAPAQGIPSTPIATPTTAEAVAMTPPTTPVAEVAQAVTRATATTAEATATATPIMPVAQATQPRATATATPTEATATATPLPLCGTRLFDAMARISPETFVIKSSSPGEHTLLPVSVVNGEIVLEYLYDVYISHNKLRFKGHLSPDGCHLIGKWEQRPAKGANSFDHPGTKPDYSGTGWWQAAGDGFAGVFAVDKDITTDFTDPGYGTWNLTKR